MVQRAIAVGIGNFMEWFDFAVYGFFAIIIGKEFFGSDSPWSGRSPRWRFSRSASSPAHSAASSSDRSATRFGRRTSLTISVVGMGVATGLIGLSAVRQHRRRCAAAPGAVALRAGPLGGR
jgi:MHS family proline/betaine transporter-like MFS transporter